MNKKLLYIPIAALMLTACANENTTPEVTTAVSAETTVPVTEPTLTESITEEETAEKIPENHEVVIAVYNPFADAAKIDDEAFEEIADAVEKISDGRAILYCNFFHDTSKYVTSYADHETVLEQSDEYDYEFCPLNPEIAATEDELHELMRGTFTENYISDEEIDNLLFAPSDYDNQPFYKTIDGVLCIKEQYTGVITAIDFEKVYVAELDGGTATAVAYGLPPAYPPVEFTMQLVKSDKYGWRLDSVETKEYWQDEATILYNAISLREDTLNAILGGGNTPENAAVITVDGENYTETDLGMSISEMHDFFSKTFREYIFKSDQTDGASLRGRYIETYIDKVYLEQDGTLYRRDSAPEWYLPEYLLDPYEMMGTIGGYEIDSLIECSQPFYDHVKETDVRAKIVVVYEDDHESEMEKSDYIYIASDLPIRKVEQS